MLHDDLQKLEEKLKKKYIQNASLAGDEQNIHLETLKLEIFYSKIW